MSWWSSLNFLLYSELLWLYEDSLLEAECGSGAGPFSGPVRSDARFIETPLVLILILLVRELNGPEWPLRLKLIPEVNSLLVLTIQDQVLES
jgi:hypothetical protein